MDDNKVTVIEKLWSHKPCKAHVVTEENIDWKKKKEKDIRLKTDKKIYATTRPQAFRQRPNPYVVDVWNLGVGGERGKGGERCSDGEERTFRKKYLTLLRSDFWLTRSNSAVINSNVM